jgi:shikimate kinase
VVKSTSENAPQNKYRNRKPDDRLKKTSGKTVQGKTVQGKKPAPAKARLTRGKASVRAVFLVGFMGAGKSSVGQALGARLNWTFEDLDDRVERHAGRKVAEIFRDAGEAEFRRAEHAALRSVIGEFNRGAVRIVALGGGAFVQPDNAALLKAANAATVYLEASVAELWQRCCNQASAAGAQRPLLQSKEQFQALHEKRRRSYEQASHRIRTDKRSVEAIAAEIERTLGLKRMPARDEQGDVE